MKKIVPIYILICWLLACTNADEAIINRSKEPIIFSSLRSLPQTRYANDNEDNYYVYGYVDGQNAEGWLINSLVTPNVDGATTDYITNGGYYWPGNGDDVYFYAFAPTVDTLGINSVTATSATPSILIDYQVITSAQSDFTIATPLKQNSGQVSLVFYHMLSKINVNVSLSSALQDAGYTVGDYTTQLQVAYDKNYIDAVYDTESSTMASWKDSLSCSSSSGSITYYNTNSYIIMPQEFTPTSIDSTNNSTVWGTCILWIEDIKVMLTVNDEVSTVFSGTLMPYGLKDDDIPDNTFLSNKQYNINFTITDVAHDSNDDPIFRGAVAFDVTLADWTGAGYGLPD